MCIRQEGQRVEMWGKRSHDKKNNEIDIHHHLYLKTLSFDWFHCLVIHPGKLLMTVEKQHKQPSEHVYPVKNVVFPATLYSLLKGK